MTGLEDLKVDICDELPNFNIYFFPWKRRHRRKRKISKSKAALTTTTNTLVKPTQSVLTTTSQSPAQIHVTTFCYHNLSCFFDFLKLYICCAVLFLDVSYRFLNYIWTHLKKLKTVNSASFLQLCFLWYFTEMHICNITCKPGDTKFLFSCWTLEEKFRISHGHVIYSIYSYPCIISSLKKVPLSSGAHLLKPVYGRFSFAYFTFLSSKIFRLSQA